MGYIVRVRLFPIIGPEFFLNRNFKFVRKEQQAQIFTHKIDAEHAAEKHRPFSKVIEVKG